MDREFGECDAINVAQTGRRDHILWVTVQWSGHADFLAEPDTRRRPDRTCVLQAQRPATDVSAATAQSEVR
jgi:hypothetical protein